jgi:hypothetical protein
MLGIFKIGSPEFFFLKKKVSSASAENCRGKHAFNLPLPTKGSVRKYNCEFVGKIQGGT